MSENDFEQHRPLLFSIAYRMLGSAMEAEDMVQEAYLRYQQTDPDAINTPKAYLSTVVTRLCLDHLKSARVQRESYMGPWLPEPMLTDSINPSKAEAQPEQVMTQHESISIAFLVLLESLSPVERAVFLLREAFDYDYDEIAQIVDKSIANCRQIYSRARNHIVSGRPRFEPSEDEQKTLLIKFLHASQTGDLNALTQLLAQDAALWSDGGGKISAATRPLFGAAVIARFFIGITKKAPEDGHVTFEQINGNMALLIWIGDSLRTVITVVTDGQHISEIHAVSNPDKLRYLSEQLSN